MTHKNQVRKPGSSNPMQKGERRQRLHADQDNVGDPKNKPKYENLEGRPIE